MQSFVFDSSILRTIKSNGFTKADDIGDLVSNTCTMTKFEQKCIQLDGWPKAIERNENVKSQKNICQKQYLDQNKLQNGTFSQLKPDKGHRNALCNRMLNTESPSFIGRKRSQDSSAYGADDDLYEVILNPKLITKSPNNLGNNRRVISNHALYLSCSNAVGNNKSPRHSKRLTKQSSRRRNKHNYQEHSHMERSEPELAIHPRVSPNRGQVGTTCADDVTAVSACNSSENQSLNQKPPESGHENDAIHDDIGAATPLTYKPRTSLSRIFGMLGEQVWNIFSPAHDEEDSSSNDSNCNSD